MSEELVMTIGAEAIKTTIMLSAPLLLAAMVIGVVISVLQAVTQINEATLTFIPKMLGVVFVLIVTAPWMLRLMKDYAIFIFGNAGEWIR